MYESYSDIEMCKSKRIELSKVTLDKQHFLWIFKNRILFLILFGLCPFFERKPNHDKVNQSIPNPVNSFSDPS